MEKLKIDPPFTQNEAKEIIIKLCEFANHKNGMIKCWVWDGSPAQFYALFNKTVAQKPLVGIGEWTFDRDSLESMNQVGKLYTESIELKLAAKTAKDEEFAVYYKPNSDASIISEAELVAFNSKLLTFITIL